MKQKKIKKLLEHIIIDLASNIKNPRIRNIIQFGSYITGGSIASLIAGDKVNDYDFYFYNSADAEEVRRYFQNYKDEDNGKYKLNLITENSINLSENIQLITKFAGSHDEVVSKFDWLHIRSVFYYDKATNSYELSIPEDTYRLICEKDLVYTGSDYPLSSLIRLRKYMRKGWNVSTATITQIAMEVVMAFRENDSTLIDVDTLVHHLNGVDPLTIIAELERQTGKLMSLDDVIEILNRC